MTMNSDSSGTLCREVEDALSQVLEGSASATIYDHIAGCDACRDLRHDANLASEMVAEAGADFRAPEDFGRALAARLEAALIDTGRVSGSKSSAATPDAAPSTTLTGDARVHGEITTAATTFAPLAGLGPSKTEADEPSTQRGGYEPPKQTMASSPDAEVRFAASGNREAELRIGEANDLGEIPKNHRSLTSG